MLNLFKREQPDLIHAITLKYAFMAGIAARLGGNRILFTIAGLGYLFSGEGLKPKALRILIGPLLKFALKHEKAKIIFQNPDDQALMIKRGFANPAQCTLIPGSGVDLDEFPLTPLPQNDLPLILMPTRLVHNKGIAIFIEAAEILEKQGVQARYQIAGGITKNNPLAISENEMSDMLNGSPVEWLGKVSDMPALYQNANLICYPSYYGEGIPKVLLETCASARPIITTDHPGCREAVRHGENGLLIPVKDPQATAEAVKALLTQPQKMQEMAAAARKLAEENFDVRLIVSKTLQTYE